MRHRFTWHHVRSSKRAVVRWSSVQNRYFLAFASREASKQPPGLDATLSALPVLLAQLALENLAVSILGQLRDKLDSPRLLITGQMLPTKGIHFLLSYGHPRTQCYDRFDTFAPQWVGDTYYRDFIDRRVLEQDLLDLPRVDIIAT